MEKDGGRQDLLCGRPWCRSGQSSSYSYQCYLGACACSLVENIMRRMVIPKLALLAVIFRPANVSAFPHEIQMLDPVLDHIAGTDARLERIAMGFD
jgi:hypothetical protein